jgi:hypothetical protein
MKDRKHHASGSSKDARTKKETSSLKTKSMKSDNGSDHLSTSFKNLLPDLTNHNPRFAPVIHPTLQTGVETLLVSAKAWLSPDASSG